MDSMLTLTANVLRRPGDVVAAAADPALLPRLVPRLLAITLVGAGLFGVVVGSYRGGVQMAYAGLKMPLLFLVPLAFGLPAVHALLAAEDASPHRVGVAGLVGAARASVLAAALGPLVWLVYSLGIDYHVAVVLLAGCLVCVGLPGLSTVRHALPGAALGRIVPLCASVLVLGAITAQTGWLLRPFVARPTVEVTLLRPVEEDVFSALRATTRAAVGDYEAWEVESSGLIGNGLRRRAADVEEGR